MKLPSHRVFGSLVALSLAAHSHAHGTIQYGFEESPNGAVPPFVTIVYPPAGSSSTRVIDTTADPLMPPPFEGTKYLLGSGITRLQSPDGLPIQSFTAHVIMSPS